MVGDNIKRLRIEHHLTQKELADRLFVTAQAVSRWEKGDVEPSLRTIAELAKIFEVPSDVILGLEEPDFSTPKKDEATAQEEPSAHNASKEDPEPRAFAQIGHAPQMLALCEQCNRPIYEADEIVRFRRKNGTQIRCRECHLRIEKTIELKLEQEQTERENKCRKKAKWARIKCLALAALLAVWYLYSFIGSIMDTYASEAGLFALGAVILLVLFYMGFSFLSCCWLRNTFFGKMLATITMFLFDLLNELLDFDDFVFFLIFGVFYLIALVIGAVIALIVGLFVAPVLFPFAMCKSLKHPEQTKLNGFWKVAD